MVRSELPTQPGAQYIRLLSFKGPSQYSLTTHQLDEAPQFHALSYCWGDSGATATVEVDGEDMCITPNLHLALEQLRELDYTLVWADAICIDQENIREKNHQVALMGLIYQTAQMTVVYLGPKGPDHEQTVQDIRLLAAAYQKKPHAFKSITSQLPLHTYEELAELGLPAWGYYNDPRLRRVGTLFMDKWFNRAWIIQEVVLAKEVVVLKGPASFKLSELDDAEAVLIRLSAFHTCNQPLIWRCRDLVDTRNLVRRGGTNVLMVLRDHRRKKCNDDRDSIFSMLGIFDWLAKKGQLGVFVVPDYEARVDEVFVAFASELLRDHRDLTILECLRPSDRPPLDLPSWVPDFGATEQTPMFDHASFEFTATKNSKPLVRVDGKFLHLHGHYLDTIVDISSHIPDIWSILPSSILLSERPGTAAEIARILRSRAYVWPRRGTYITGQSAREAYWQSFLAIRRSEDEVVQYCCQHDGWDGEAADPHNAGCPDGCTCTESYESNCLASPYLTEPKMSKMMATQWRLSSNMTMARTRLGYYCWVPWPTRVGDEIVLCSGSKAPLAIRRLDKPGESRYQMLGSCWVTGVMEGEAWRPDDLQEMWFE